MFEMPIERGKVREFARAVQSTTAPLTALRR